MSSLHLKKQIKHYAKANVLVALLWLPLYFFYIIPNYPESSYLPLFVSFLLLSFSFFTLKNSFTATPKNPLHRLSLSTLASSSTKYIDLKEWHVHTGLHARLSGLTAFILGLVLLYFHL